MNYLRFRTGSSGPIREQSGDTEAACAWPLNAGLTPAVPIRTLRLLDVRILGPIDIAGAARALPRGRQRTILALLALRANEVVSTQRLVATAWRESPPGGVENLVQVYVSRLRGLLGRDRLERVD